MLLLFAGGVMNLWWIIGVTLCVALEKPAPAGDRLVKLSAAVLLIAGTALLL